MRETCRLLLSRPELGGKLGLPGDTFLPHPPHNILSLIFISVAELVINKAELNCRPFQKKALCQIRSTWYKNHCTVRRHQRQHHATGGTMLKGVAALLLPGQPAVTRVPEAQERPTANEATTVWPKLPPLSEKPSEEPTCADFNVHELLAEIRKANFLEVGWAYMAIFWPAPGFKEKHFDSSEFPAEGTSISASAVSYCGGIVEVRKQRPLMRINFFVWNTPQSASDVTRVVKPGLIQHRQFYSVHICSARNSFTICSINTENCPVHDPVIMPDWIKSQLDWFDCLLG